MFFRILLYLALAWIILRLFRSWKGLFQPADKGDRPLDGSSASEKGDFPEQAAEDAEFEEIDREEEV